MPSDVYRAYFELAARETYEAALLDLNRLIEVLQEHAPDLLPLYHRPDKKQPGAEVIKRKAIA